MVLLLAELDVEPVGDALEPFGLGIERHGKVEIGRPQFGVDLRIERIVELLTQHNRIVFG